MVRYLASALLICAAGPACAHPHVFIDTRVEVIFDKAGKAAQVRITWTYDDFYSLSILTDQGYDPDGDGKLTDDEERRLPGFDMHWETGYPGDTYALFGETPLQLGPPHGYTAEIDNGKLVSTHLRDIEPAVDPVEKPLVIRSYDPSYYVEYTITDPPKVTGRDGCEVALVEPDLTAADKQLQDALSKYSADMDVEMDYPAVGAAFADEVRVQCASHS